MRKLFLVTVFFVVTILQTIAQPYSNSEKIILTAKADSIIKNYLQKSSLIEDGGFKQNDKIMLEFKSLFLPDAMIFDDINAYFDSTETVGNPYKLKTKPLNEYFRGLVYEFPKGLIVANKKINANYTDFDNGKIEIALERIIRGTSHSNQYSLFNHDTLLISLIVTSDKSVKIKSVSSLNKINNIKVLNDKDNDGVIDLKDECPEQRGKLSLNGCPDRDNDGIPDKDDDCPGEYGDKSNRGCPPSTFTYSLVFSGSIGYNFNKNILQTPTSGFDYAEMDRELSELGKVKNPGIKPSVSLNGSLAYYFGKKKFKKNFGIAAGLFITNYKADYTVNGIKYFFKSNDSFVDYRRIVTLDEAKENISFSLLNFDLQLKYRGKLKNTKWATELGFGPGFITSINRSSYEAKLDYEGIYQFNEATANFEYTQHFNEQNSNWILIGDHINMKDNSSAITAFDLLQRQSSLYDFELNRVFTENEKVLLNTRTGISVNAQADIMYHISSKIAAKGGISLLYANLINSKKGNYKMADNRTDKYNSIYNSKAKSNLFSWGIHIGLALGI
jgi:hypothetical protein